MLFHPGVLAGTGGFNGGKSQINLNSPGNGGSYPFINLFKSNQGWSFRNNANAPVTPDLLDSNGYPTTIINLGVYTVFNVPTQAERPGNYVITWDGNGTIALGMQNTLVSGSLTSGGGSGRYVFSTTAGGGGNDFSVGISAIGNPYINNLKVFHADDEALLLAGEVFATKFKQRLKEANFGVIRFLNWQDGNTTNITTWNTRKPVSYYTYLGNQLPPDRYAGVTTNVGNAYSVSAPANWNGLVDKAMVLIKFNASANGASTLNVGGTGDITILNESSAPLTGSTYPTGGTWQSLAALTYEVTLNAWVKQGGDAVGSVGIENGVPYELVVQLCTEVGAHPYFTMPAHAIDPMTDFVPSLAAYVRDNSPSWMIPRFEGPNETWNFAFGFFSTGHAVAMANAYGWGSDFHNWYGKALSTVGQAVSAVYGDDRTRYHVLCGVQTGTGNTTGGTHSSNARLSSALYVAQANPAQSGYTKTAASNWVTHVCNTQYFDPSEYKTNQELVDAYNYAVTYASDPTTQASIAASYVATCTDSVNGSFTIPKLATFAANWKTWGEGFGVNKMCGYEGGYSPDYLGTAVTSTISGATSANPCVLTLATTSLQGTATTGNPAVVGMTLTISGLGDAMGTALNGNTYTVTAVSGNSVTINADTSLVGAFTTNGTATYVNAPTWLNGLRLAGKSAPLLQNYLTSIYSDYVGVSDGTFTAEFPSCFQLTGQVPSNNAWSVLEDIYQTPNPPQWLAIVAFNN